jgi:hypothetical protein
MILMTSVAIGGGVAGATALLYKFFSRDKHEEEINFENDLSKIESVFSVSDSCIIRPSLTPKSASKLPKNKVIIGKN